MYEKVKDLTGQRFGRLTVIKHTGSDKWRNSTWLCKCDCGNEVIISGRCLHNGTTKSCGCLYHKNEKLIPPKDKMKRPRHGLSHTRLMTIYRSMKTRCYNENHKRYHCYGGRGIIVCDEWKYSFQAFYDWSMENGYQDGLQIDRINNDGNYEPSNCRWVTGKTNSNNRSTNNLITYNGECHTLTEWSEILGVKRGTLAVRYLRGWRDEKLFSTIRKRN